MQNHGLETVTNFEQILLGGLSQLANIFGIFDKKPHLVSVVREKHKLVL